MTESEVKTLLKQTGQTWEDFESFMRGKTVGINEDGSENYYKWDVNRFLTEWIMHEAHKARTE